MSGENEIMERFEVARNTARDALALLRGWGLTETRPGSGTYVRDFRPVIRDGIQRLSGETWPSSRSIWSAEAEGRDLTVDQIEVREDDAPPERVCRQLELPPDAAVVMRSRRFVLDGKPVLIAQSWLPAVIAAGTAIAQPDTGPGGTYARLRDLGRTPVRFREDVRSRMPLPEEAERLALAAATPVVEVVRLAWDRDDAPVELNEMTADASAYIFRYEFGA
jgi:GntR family transcriptional regulator